MNADNARLVVILGQMDFSGGLANRINAERKSLGEPEIAVALVAPNDGQLAGAEKYYAAHPDSRLTVLHGRAYENLHTTITRLRALGQRIVLIEEHPSGQTAKTIKSRSDELGVDEIIIEASSLCCRDVGRAITRLLGLKPSPEHSTKDNSASDGVSSAPTARRSTDFSQRPMRPATRPVARTHIPPTAPRSQTDQHEDPVPPNLSRFPTPHVPFPAMSSHSPGAVAAELPTPHMPFPSTPSHASESDAPGIPASRLSTLHERRLFMTASIEAPTASAPTLSEGQTFPIERLFADLESLVDQDAAEIRSRIQRLQATDRWLAELQTTGEHLREKISMALAELPAETMPSAMATESRLVSTTTPALVRRATSHDGDHRGEVTGHEIVPGMKVLLSGTRVNELFAALRNRNGDDLDYHPQGMAIRFGVSKQAIYQAALSLRRQLREQLGERGAQCLTCDSSTGYRWDPSALTPH